LAKIIINIDFAIKCTADNKLLNYQNIFDWPGMF